MSRHPRMDILQIFQTRFEQNPERHSRVQWEDVLQRLTTNPDKLKALSAMESSGGEPDVVGFDESGSGILIYDCSAESPAGRRSLCYDRPALLARKKHKPVGSALDLAVDMGIQLLTETEYRKLQQLGEFDRKTSSWVLTPGPIRRLGGALFCDRRYNQVFLYHNGADSYYATRGFRGRLII